MRVFVIADCLEHPTTRDDAARWMQLALRERRWERWWEIQHDEKWRDYDLGILVWNEFVKVYEGYIVPGHGYLGYNVKFQITGYQCAVIGCTHCIIYATINYAGKYRARDLAANRTG